jgi:hypothetical protein
LILTELTKFVKKGAQSLRLIMNGVPPSANF